MYEDDDVVEKKLGGQGGKSCHYHGYIMGQLLQMWLIISFSSSLSVPGSSDCPDLISSSSLKMGSLHCSSKGAVLYFMSLVFIGVRELLTTSQSLAIELTVLPVRVLLSSSTSAARQRTLTLCCSHSIWPFQLYMDTFSSIWASLQLYIWTKGNFEGILMNRVSNSTNVGI